MRIGGLALALCLPVVIGGLISGSSTLTLVRCIVSVCIYLAFWTWLTLWLTQVIEGMVSLPDGGEIVLTQREAVNDAWDVPREATYTPFLELYPEWAMNRWSH